MRNKQGRVPFRIAGWALLFWISAWLWGGIENTDAHSDLETFLKQARIQSVEKGQIPGRTNAWNITLSDGKTVRRAVFKHVDFLRPTLLPDSYRYELAAYEMDKILALNRIPPVVEREIEGVNGSLQLRLEHCIPLDELQRTVAKPPDVRAFENQLEELNVFENLVYCVRKEEDDVLVQKDGWKVYRVDFSEAFSTARNLIPGQEISRCSKKLYRSLQGLNEEAVSERLQRFLNLEEIEALFERRAKIVNTIALLIQKKGRAAVLF